VVVVLHNDQSPGPPRSPPIGRVYIVINTESCLGGSEWERLASWLADGDGDVFLLQPQTSILQQPHSQQPAHRPTNHGTKQPPSAIEWPTSQPCRACVRRGTTAERAGVWKAGWSKRMQSNPTQPGEAIDEEFLADGRWRIGLALPAGSGDGPDVCLGKWVMVPVGLGLSQLREPLDVSSSHLRSLRSV